MPGIDIDRKEVAIATKVSKYKTDSYTEYFHKILLKDYTGELQVYTDGSKNEEGRLGVAFVIYHIQVEIRTCQARLSDNNSVYHAELYAIYDAVNWIMESNFNSALTATDSLSHLNAIKDQMPEETHKLLKI